jgi:uncharacterized membrane protein
MEAFSDGVFAIAITLIALEIVIPPDRGSDLLNAVVEQWPSYLAYLVSFATIGAVWMAHAAITDLLDHVDQYLLRLNLVLLLIVGVLPIPTKLLAEYMHSLDGERVAVTIYGLFLLSSRLMVLAMWQYGVRRGLIIPSLSDEEADGVRKKLTPSLAGYVVALGIGVVLPLLAVFMYLAIALYLLLPLRSLSGSGPA